MFRKIVKWYKERTEENDRLRRKMEGPSSKTVEKWEEDNKDFDVFMDELEKDISEPVISFLKVFKENPRRFKLSYTSDNQSVYDLRGWSNSYVLTDRVTGEEFHATGCGKLGYVITTPEFITLDEYSLIIETLQDYYVNRETELILARRKRTLLRQIRERERLTAIYKTKEEGL